jgi:hypothetical protein
MIDLRTTNWRDGDIMAPGLIKKTATVLVLLVAAPTLLSACGRDGSPLKPSQAAIERAKEAKEEPPQAPTPNSENTEKRFVLDGLLE